jgi:hypothetical protein
MTSFLMKHEELATTATIYVRRKTATCYGNVAELWISAKDTEKLSIRSL